MDEDARDLRKAPENWREYLYYAKEAGVLFKWIWLLIPAESKRRCRMMFVYLGFQTAASLLLSRFVGTMMDGAVKKSMYGMLFGTAGTILCFTAALFFEYLFARNREVILGLNWGAVDTHITKAFFAKSVGQHIQESSTLAVPLVDKGRWRLLDLQGLLLFEGAPTLVSLAFAYAFLWVILPGAAAIMTMGIVFYLLRTIYLNREVMVTCAPIDKEFRALNRYRVERWEKVERVKVCVRGEEEVLHTEVWFDKTIARDCSFWIWFIGQNTWRGAANKICLLLAVLCGSWFVWHKQWPAALLFPTFMWCMQIVENIWKIGHMEHQFNWAAPSVRAMIDALSMPPNIISGIHRIKSDEPLVIRFGSVGHAYPNENSSEKRMPILEHVCFEIGDGEKVALLGESGAGKTTIMRLLLRYMDPTSGTIFVQDNDLRDIDLDSWWRTVGYIAQQPQIFDGSIRDNLTYALSGSEREKISDKELWSLMELLQIDFGARLANGLNTLVGKNGLKLSGGEAQRLMIGAAAVKKPRFMIIDEATSSLDSSTEKLVQQGLAKILTPDVGALVVAHRLSTVRHLCNKFVILQPNEAVSNGNSQIEAVGASFEELYDVSSIFRRLADDQGIAIQSKVDAAGMHLIS